jgi:hypothetical protein
VKLTNLGPADAVHVKAWLEDSEGTRVTPPLIGDTIRADESLVVELPLGDEYWNDPPPLTLIVEQWTESGPEARQSNDEVVLE